MSRAGSPPDLFALGQHALRRFSEELRAYGIEADPGLALRRGHGLLCSYDLADRTISLSLPDLTAPAGKLHLLIFRDLLGASDDGELLRFLALFVPFLVAHELAHHLRHRYGMFGGDRWHEEQVANQLAVAMVKHHLTPEERAFARRLLGHAVARLTQRQGTETVDSYHEIARALNAVGELANSDLVEIGRLQSLLATSSVDLLTASGQLHSRLGRRADLIDTINRQYASDAFRYIDYQVSWLFTAMSGGESHYVEEFARRHLQRSPSLLSRVGTEGATPRGVQACYRAYRETALLSETASRYFYKRYRSLLLAQLQAAHGEALLETWDQGETDTLSYLTGMAPSELRDLFPHRIAGHLPADLSLPRDLPTATDARLWEHVTLRAPTRRQRRAPPPQLPLGAPDPDAANTLARLAILERLDLFRPLPAEVLLELAHTFCRKKLVAGEPLVWAGERDDDVYVLVDGSLEVLGRHDERPIDILRPGEVCGEMAWLTKAARTATVRAVTTSECLVLRGADLHVLAFHHPAVLMEIAGVVTRRLARMGLATEGEG